MTKQKIKIDFIGIGTARSATTWITECLKEHPQIKFIQKIYQFLEVNPDFTPQKAKQKINPSVNNLLKIKSLEKISPNQLNKKIFGKFLIKILKIFRLKNTAYKKIRSWNTKNANNLKTNKFKKTKIRSPN